MKAPVRYVFLLLFIVVFIYLFISISARLNELIDQKSSSTDERPQLDDDDFKQRKRVRLRKFKNYIDDLESDESDLNQNSNRSVWKQVSYRSPFGFSNQGHNHHSSYEFAKNCRLSNCFDFSKCKPGDVLRIHIYPDPNELINSGQLYISSTYKKILHIIRQSKYYEPDPKKACIYVTSFDTLDRDPLSVDYQKNLPRFIPVDNGKNHVIFNLYSGTWPSYNEIDFSNFNPGLAMLIKASIRYQDYRPDFDISLPLFSKTHPLRGDTLPINNNPNIGSNQQKSYSIRYMNASSLNKYKYNTNNLLVFKGKRYIYGIGSETRNMLHHLGNQDDILIYTTCKHGKKWKELKDERCNTDNSEYDKHDYNKLMRNSTFCLVPRGRRLGSYRFLEALGSSCIPVVLSNGWVKPFDSVIDWSSIVIDSDERMLLNLPEVLRSISWRKIAKMRSASLRIYEKYFSSVEKIILTTIKILEQRIQSQMSLNSFIWNIMSPGALWFHNEYSNRLTDYPFVKTNQLIETYQREEFTAIIYINKPISSSVIFHLLKNLAKSEFLVKVLILWALPVEVPKTIINENIQLFSSKLDIEVLIPEIKTVNAKLYPYESIKTNCVLNLEPDTTLTYEELDFAFRIWQSFKHRIIGFVARDHYYDETKSIWYYTSKWTNQYSIILLDGAFFHKYWAWLYTNYVFNHNLTSNYLFKTSSTNESQQDFVGNYVGDFGRVVVGENTNENTVSSSICLDLIFNFLISHVTREPPIKVSQRKKTSNQSFLGLSMSGGTFSDSQKCFQNLLNYTFNYLPLVKSQLRLDPLLFKDPVSTLRKKYRKMEQFT